MAAAPFSILRRQALSIHSRLMMLTVVTVLPLVAVGGFAIIRTVDDQKVQVEQAVGRTVDGLLGDIDRQITDTSRSQASLLRAISLGMICGFDKALLGRGIR
jgi:hypothetical protein